MAQPKGPDKTQFSIRVTDLAVAYLRCAGDGRAPGTHIAADIEKKARRWAKANPHLVRKYSKTNKDKHDHIRPTC